VRWFLLFLHFSILTILLCDDPHSTAHLAVPKRERDKERKREREGESAAYLSDILCAPKGTLLVNGSDKDRYVRSS